MISLAPCDSLFADKTKRLGSHLVDPPAGFEMTGELRVIQAGFKFLDQFGGSHDFDSLCPHQFDRARIHHRDIRDRAKRRILHGHALRSFQQPRQFGVLFLPAGILRLLAWQRADDVGFDPMHEAARFARGGNQVIPAPGHMVRLRETEHAISQRVAPVMIEEQPAVKLFAPQRFLNSKEVHAIRE